MAPACPTGVSPSQCFIILTRTTAIQATSDGLAYPTTVKQDGWVVAFTVGLSRLSTNAATEKNYLHVLDAAYGGTPQLALTVLTPGPRHKYTVAAQSATFHLIPFLGSVLNEPLSLPPTFTQFTALKVKKGDVLALTIPTWAPVLSYNLNASKFVYRQSRKANCKHAAGGQTAQLTVGASTQYLCTYGAPGSSTRRPRSPPPDTPRPTCTAPGAEPVAAGWLARAAGLGRGVAPSRRRGSAGRTPSPEAGPAARAGAATAAGAVAVPAPPPPEGLRAGARRGGGRARRGGPARRCRSRRSPTWCSTSSSSSSNCSSCVLTAALATPLVGTLKLGAPAVLVVPSCRRPQPATASASTTATVPAVTAGRWRR